MTNYLIMPDSVPEHYFFKPYEGICMRRRRDLSVWQDHSPVFERGKDGFGVYADQNGTVHLISADSENKLIYGVCKNDIWKKYVISKLSGDIFVSDMQLYSIRGRLNLLYSALYNGENLLVHCILGDRAKPEAVDVMENSHFCIQGDKVYYTNKNGSFGFVSLADEKPEGFTPLYDDAHWGTVYSFGDSEKVLFSRDSKLFLNGKELLYDSRLELPVLVRGKDKLYIMWKSGSFVRYITSSDGEDWNEPMRFMSTGAVISLYTVQKDDRFFYYYGYHSSKGPVLLGNPDIFDTPPEYSAPVSPELAKIREMLSETQRDVTYAKKELARLGKVIGSLSDHKGL